MCSIRRRSLLFLCLPSLAVLDSWISVINEIKKITDYRLVFLAPRARTIREVNHRNIIHRLAGELFDEFVWVDRWNNWIAMNDLFHAREKACESKWLPRFFSPNRVVLKEYIKRLDVAGVLYDLSIEKNKLSPPIAEILNSSTKKFSIAHGAGMGYEASVPPLNASRLEPQQCIELANQKKLRTDVTVYLYSQLHEKAYRSFGIHPNCYRIVGIPRHEKSWVDTICENNCEPMPAGFEKDFILVLSRPAGSDYFPPERKLSAIKDIKKISRLLDKKIVIKKHPKENFQNGGARSLYEEILGEDQYGKAWVYADQHIFVLGKRADISICYFSSTPADMIVTSTPVISRSDMRGLEKYDTPASYRDSRGSPVKGARALGLCLGADDYYDLRGQVERIMHNRKAVLDELRCAYDTVFPMLANPNKSIALEIKTQVA